VSSWPKGSPHTSADVVVVGAGLAGLNAAHHLAEAGLDVMVLEADPQVGGRIRTDEVDGFRLDRGFQLYNPSYPEGIRSLDHEALDLKPFVAGAVLVTDKGPRWMVDPRRAGRASLRNLRAPLGPRGMLQVTRYVVGCAVTDPRELQQRPDMSTREAFSRSHLGGTAMSLLLTPFLSGVLADPDLRSSRRFTDFVLRSLVRGTPSVPAVGMQAIPDQLARPLRSRIFRGVRVESVTPTRVETAAGGIDCEAVVVATDPGTAARLVPGVPQPTMRSLTTWYFSIDEDDLYGGRPVLVLESDGRGPLTNAVVMSYAAPDYAPAGRHLLQATAVGLPDADVAAVRRHLAELYGVPTGHWELIGHYPIAEALPAAVPPFSVRGTQEFDGIVVAGDHRDTPSIQGALVSGRRAAQKVRRRFV
jgi:phytoene dehydrogenase-like protein